MLDKQGHPVSRPTGEPTPGNFKLAEAEVSELQHGQVLVRNHCMSLDPYMRGRMNDGKSDAQPQPLNAVMQGGTVGEVVAAKSAACQVGDKVGGMGGWQQYPLADAQTQGVMRKVDATRVPLSADLGAVGMRRVTAWACGKLEYRETVAQGIEAAPEAFLGLLEGRNFGKQRVNLI